MKYLFSLFLFLSSVSTAQTIDSVRYKVSFKFSYLNDTTKPSSFYKEDMLLLVGDSIVKYQSLGSYLFDSIMIDEQSAANYLNGNATLPTNSYNNLAYYNFYKKNKFYGEDKIYDKYLITIDFPIIKWDIVNQAKNILGLECQKAICKFKGRYYSVWFSNSIPISSGPWKLNGLPGLILEAEDDKKQVLFSAYKIEKNRNNTLLIKFPDKNTKVTNERYLEIKYAFYDDPVKFIENSTGFVITTPLDGYHPKKKSNNPIELSKD